MPKTLKIAILAPIKRPINLQTTVSRNRIIADLVQGLMKKGHQVSIFGTADSHLPGAEIVGIAPMGLNMMPAAENEFYQHTGYLTLMIRELIKRQSEFDLVHNHMYPEYLPLIVNDLLKIPLVTTVHSQMTELTAKVLREYPQAHLVAISHMAKKMAGIDSMSVIHNGIDTELFQPDDRQLKNYLLAAGRMSKAKDKSGNFLDPKGIQNSIKLAQNTGERLKIVGNVEDPQFFEKLVKPHLNDKIEFIGEVSAEQKLTREDMVLIYQGAKAFLNPINWEEPFGLVMVEALACGTPVIAYDRGAVSEIVRDGMTGFIVEPSGPAAQQPQNQPTKGHPAFGAPRLASPNGKNYTWMIKQIGIEGLVEAVKRIGEIDPQACRDHAVNHFSIQRMVDEYEKLYMQISEGMRI